MNEVKGKIIKKTVTRVDPEYSAGEAHSSLIEGEVYDASQVAKNLVQRAQHQADEIATKARQEANAILEAARSEQERIVQEATDRGYQEGLGKTTEWVVRAKDFYQRGVESGKSELKMLAVKIAEKIIGRALELSPELINDIVSQAIRTLRQQKNVTVRCNETDYEILKKNEKEFLELLGQSGMINLMVDSKIARGGCIVESEIGIVDARLETQFKTLQKVLLSK